MTVEQLLEEVNNRMTDQETQTALQAACWFVAYREALGLSDGWRTKDFASIIQKGETIGGPYETEAHLKEWLDDRIEWGDEDSTIIEMLDDHFGK